MSKQPSERAFDVASDWQGHKFDCAIHRDPGRDDADCTCIVRDLARAIDAAIVAARAEAYEEAAQIAFPPHADESKSQYHLRRDLAAAIRAIAAQETKSDV